MDFNRATTLGLLAHQDADFAGLVVALLVAQHFEPDEKIDLAGAIAQARVTEIAHRDEFEVLVTLFGRTDVRRDEVAGRPVLRQILEHRVAVRQVGVERGDELPFELERKSPDETLQDRTHVVVAQQQVPQRLGEVGAELVLLELPNDGLGAVVDEHLPQRLRTVQQPLAQQSELLLENSKRLAVLEFLDFALRGLERTAHLAITLEILGVGTRREAHRHRCISAHG